MTRKRTDPGYRPKAKYMSELFNLQMTPEQRTKLGQLARWSGPKPMSAAAWVRKQIDAATCKS